jgi:hypothetical protein
VPVSQELKTSHCELIALSLVHEFVSIGRRLRTRLKTFLLAEHGQGTKNHYDRK